MNSPDNGMPSDMSRREFLKYFTLGVAAGHAAPFGDPNLVTEELEKKATFLENLPSLSPTNGSKKVESAPVLDKKWEDLNDSEKRTYVGGWVTKFLDENVESCPGTIDSQVSDWQGASAELVYENPALCALTKAETSIPGKTKIAQIMPKNRYKPSNLALSALIMGSDTYLIKAQGRDPLFLMSPVEVKDTPFGTAIGFPENGNACSLVTLEKIMEVFGSNPIFPPDLTLEQATLLKQQIVKTSKEIVVPGRVPTKEISSLAQTFRSIVPPRLWQEVGIEPKLVYTPNTQYNGGSLHTLGFDFDFTGLQKTDPKVLAANEIARVIGKYSYQRTLKVIHREELRNAFDPNPSQARTTNPVPRFFPRPEPHNYLAFGVSISNGTTNSRRYDRAIVFTG